MKKLIYLPLVLLGLISFGLGKNANASSCLDLRDYYENHGLGGSGIENEAIDNCLNQQRAQNQATRDQQQADAQNAQNINNLNVQYFYKLDALQKSISGNKYFSDCYYGSSDCMTGARITDPTILDPSALALYLPYKQKCVNYLPTCIESLLAANAKPSDSDINSACKKKYGNYSYYTGENASGTTICGCMKGYTFDDNNQCVSLDGLCKQKHGENSIGIDNLSSKTCGCADGYVMRNNQCITRDQDCQNYYGKNVHGGVSTDLNHDNSCYCDSGYTWNQDQTACAVSVVYVVSNNNLNIRLTKSTTAKVIGAMKKKTKYEVVDSSDKTWVQIKYNNKIGWVLRRLVKL